jgi:protein required for attachment to host cells
MTRSTTWILVANASRARLFRERGKSLALVETFEHEASRARVRDLMADAQGRKPNGQPGHATGHRPGAEPDTDPKEVEVQKFAHELADALEDSLLEHAWERIVIMAPPHFLGLLRGVVSSQVSRRIELDLGKDYTALRPEELAAKLRSHREAAANLS